MQLFDLLRLIHTHVDTLRHRIRRNRSDAGLSTLEIAVIALGLLTAATAVVATIKSAVDGRLESIK